MPKPRGSRALSPAALVFALLVIATLAAFAWAQRVKRDPLLVDKTHIGLPQQHAAFSPNGDCQNDKIRIRFRTTTSNDATVQIVKPGGKVMVTLARKRFLKRYHFHTFYWDGRQRSGATAPKGRYKIRVKLEDEDRLLVLPGTIHLHDVPPKPGRVCVQTKGGGA